MRQFLMMAGVAFMLLMGAAGLTACTTDADGERPGVGEVVDNTFEGATRALVSAENAFTAAAEVASTGVRTGAIPDAFLDEIETAARAGSLYLERAHATRDTAERFRFITLLQGQTRKLEQVARDFDRNPNGVAR